jgi:hypothetical protein
MAVIITEGDKRLEFSIISYEFPFRRNDEYDDNWLVIKIDYYEDGKLKTYTDPSILTFELEILIKDINGIMSGRKTSLITDFLENYLEFSVTKKGDIYAVQIKFIYDTMSEEWKEICVSQDMSLGELRLMNEGLKYYLYKFPYRPSNDSKSVVKDLPKIKGNIKSITLVSNSLTLAEPEDGEEIEQRVTININGSAVVKSYGYNDNLLNSENIQVNKDKVKGLFKHILGYFNEPRYEDVVKDVGDWELTVKNSVLKKYKFEGTFCNGSLGLTLLSDEIRNLLCRKNLMAFDNNVRDGIKFCSVEFGEGSQDYYYITDDESIEIDDLVKVPVGKNNRECIATVVDVEYFKEENAPLPLDKVKKIICKYVPKEKSDEEKADEDKEKDDK